MTNTAPQPDDRQLIDTLADLFDDVPPSTQADCDEELRSAAIDPVRVARDTEQLVARFGVVSVRKDSAPSRKWRPSAVIWSVAATLLLCIGTWLVLDAGAPGHLPRFFPRLRSLNPILLSRPQPHVDAGADPIDAQPEAQPSSPAAVFDSPANVAPPVADSATGEIVTAENVDQYASAVSPGVEWAIRQGMRLRVVAPQPVHPPRAYREGTERYSGGVQIGSDGVSMQNYIAGLPFPHIDPNDPQVAVKIMWNYAHGFFATDDVEAAGIQADSGAIGTSGRGMLVDRHFAIERFRRLFYTGRLFVDPTPILPSVKDIRYREGISPITEPNDLRGNGLSSIRYRSFEKFDDTFLYLKSLRRVRRLASAQRSDAIFGQDVDLDSFFGFSAHIAMADFRFLGEGSRLASMHAEHDPVVWGDGNGDFAFDDVWEVRPVYVIEAVSKFPQYAYGSRILYIDKEAWVIPFADLYDRKGEFWKAWINMFSVRPLVSTAPNADATRLVLPASVMVDVQLKHATRISIPFRDGAHASGWRFDQGDQAVTEDWFNLATLISNGR